MTDREFVLDVMRKSGLASARNLRDRAVAGASGTEVIGEEEFVPNYPPDGKRDFTAVPLGAPYKYDGQVYKLWKPAQRQRSARLDTRQGVCIVGHLPHD